jgi:hypothetical protein
MEAIFLIQRGDKVDYSDDLFLDLVRPAENMGVVLCECPHAEEAVENTGFLMTMYVSEFGELERQVAI